MDGLDSKAYRTYSLGYVFINIAQFLPLISLAVRSLEQGFANFLVTSLGFLAYLILPGYVLWRNITTLKDKEPLLPKALLDANPWYFRTAMVIIYLLLIVAAVSLVATLIGMLQANALSMVGAISLGSAYAIAFPLIVVMEGSVLYFRQRPAESPTE